MGEILKKYLAGKVTTFLEKNAEWIVDEDGDPGIRFFDNDWCIIRYYKWNDCFLVGKPEAHVRTAKKRELNLRGPGWVF
jgi:hypothetical protein